MGCSFLDELLASWSHFFSHSVDIQSNVLAAHQSKRVKMESSSLDIIITDIVNTIVIFPYSPIIQCRQERVGGGGAVRWFKHPPLAPGVFFFVARLLVTEVGHVREYPYPFRGKLILFLTKKTKSPPPPTRSVTFWKLARHHGLHPTVKHLPWKNPAYASGPMYHCLHHFILMIITINTTTITIILLHIMMMITTILVIIITLSSSSSSSSHHHNF